MNEQPGLLRVEPTVVTPKMNKTEAVYAELLAALRSCGEIEAWAFEPVKFKLAHRTTYTPDFGVWHTNGTVEMVEIKGFLRDDAGVKFKVARRLFPMLRWKMISKKDGRWVEMMKRKESDGE